MPSGRKALVFLALLAAYAGVSDAGLPYSSTSVRNNAIYPSTDAFWPYSGFPSPGYGDVFGYAQAFSQAGGDVDFDYDFQSSTGPGPTFVQANACSGFGCRKMLAVVDAKTNRQA